MYSLAVEVEIPRRMQSMIDSSHDRRIYLLGGYKGFVIIPDNALLSVVFVSGVTHYVRSE